MTIGGTASATGNLVGQYTGSDNIGEVDVLSVALSFGSGYLQGGLGQKFLGNIALSAFDASIDIKLNGKRKIIGETKSPQEVGMDMFVGTINAATGGVFEKSGASAGIQNARNVIVGGFTQYYNGIANDQMKPEEKKK